jgi:hypothetical protein
MYEAALPKTGLAIGVGGAAIGLSWLLVVGVIVVLAGLALARYAHRRGA